jgi:hypothetical protein
VSHLSVLAGEIEDGLQPAAVWNAAGVRLACNSLKRLGNPEG